MNTFPLFLIHYIENPFINPFLRTQHFSRRKKQIWLDYEAQNPAYNFLIKFLCNCEDHAVFDVKFARNQELKGFSG